MGASDDGHLEAAIAAQESLRGTIPDEIVDAAIAGLRAQLGARSVDRRRRQATILFADISGFTSMSESMDAEWLTVLMDDLWSALDDVVEHHGGRVDKHIGDALMAVWGAEISMEDDPEQAVRAALRLQETLGGFCSERATELAMRIGVNTGPVLLGAIGSTGEFTAMGDTVNVASRLEHAAPLNGVLISHDTYRNVRGVFDVLARAPLAIRGKSEPLQVYEVRAEKRRAFRMRSRGVEGIETSMVGRETEFRALQAALERACGTPEPIAVEVVGEAGIGKSRLLWEFENWLELQPIPVYFFTGRAVGQRQSVSLALVRDIVANRFEILDSDPPRVVVNKLVAGAENALDPNEAAVLAFWLGFGLHEVDGMTALPDGERLAQTGRAYLSVLLRSFAEDSPVVIMIEDLHWADDASIELVRWLLDGWPDLPLLVVAATRPSGATDTPRFTAEPAPHQRIVLEPLSDEQTCDLIEDILQRADAVPGELTQFVTDRADGNAFYVEELIKMLIDDGAIDIMNEPWLIQLEDAALARVPSTLSGVLQARLDALPERTRRGLQRASVIGRTFWDDAVRSLSDCDVDLEPAMDRELIFETKPSTFDGCAEFIFKHALLHDVVYETVLLQDRPELHARAATWLDGIAGSRRDELLVEIARHWEHAGDLARATDKLERAAELALRAGDATGCLKLTGRITALHSGSNTPTRSPTLVHEIRANWILGQLEAAVDLAPIAVNAAHASGSDEELANALLTAAETQRRLGEVERCAEFLDQAHEIAGRVGGLPLVESIALRIWSDVRANRPTSQQAIDRLLDLVSHLEDPSLQARAHMAIGAALDSRGDHQEGLKHFETTLEMHRRTGDRWGEALTLSNIGMNLHLRGDRTQETSWYNLATPRYRESIDLARRLGLQEVEAIATVNLAQLQLRLNDTAASTQLAQRAMRLAREIHSVPLMLMALCVHAETLILVGDRETGLAYVGLASSHPAHDLVADELDRILNRVGDGDDTQRMTSAGSALDLDSVVADLLVPEHDATAEGSPWAPRG